MDYMQYYIPVQMEFQSISSSFFVGLYQLAFLLSTSFLESTLSHIHVEQIMLFCYLESVTNFQEAKHITAIITYKENDHRIKSIEFIVYYKIESIIFWD